jgi:hypothetical protein
MFKVTLDGKIPKGIEFEMGVLHQRRQTERCIYLICTDRRVPRTGWFDFHAAFAWPGTKTSTRNFLRELKALANDDYRRLPHSADFSELGCQVIDRGIECAFEQYPEMDLSR